MWWAIPTPTASGCFCKTAVILIGHEASVFHVGEHRKPRTVTLTWVFVCRSLLYSCVLLTKSQAKRPFLAPRPVAKVQCAAGDMSLLPAWLDRAAGQVGLVRPVPLICSDVQPGGAPVLRGAGRACHVPPVFTGTEGLGPALCPFLAATALSELLRILALVSSPYVFPTPTPMSQDISIGGFFYLESPAIPPRVPRQKKKKKKPNWPAGPAISCFFLTSCLSPCHLFHPKPIQTICSSQPGPKWDLRTFPSCNFCQFFTSLLKCHFLQEAYPELPALCPCGDPTDTHHVSVTLYCECWDPSGQ